jgi:CDGSH-type Zn-finger protein
MPDPQVVIKVRDDGPYKVTGPVVLEDVDGRRFAVEDGRPIALCRCGASTTKPFCDGSHRASGFSSCERAEERGAA